MSKQKKIKGEYKFTLTVADEFTVSASSMVINVVFSITGHSSKTIHTRTILHYDESALHHGEIWASHLHVKPRRTISEKYNTYFIIKRTLPDGGVFKLGVPESRMKSVHLSLVIKKVEPRTFWEAVRWPRAPTIEYC
jgi:hypothetical protein